MPLEGEEEKQPAHSSIHSFIPSFIHSFAFQIRIESHTDTHCHHGEGTQLFQPRLPLPYPALPCPTLPCPLPAPGLGWCCCCYYHYHCYSLEAVFITKQNKPSFSSPPSQVQPTRHHIYTHRHGRSVKLRLGRPCGGAALQPIPTHPISSYPEIPSRSIFPPPPAHHVARRRRESVTG